jgi:hypothetical protein
MHSTNIGPQGEQVGAKNFSPLQSRTPDKRDKCLWKLFSAKNAQKIISKALKIEEAV